MGEPLRAGSGGRRVVALDDTLAKQAGVLVGRSQRADAVDAIMVATGVALHAAIVTSDVGDIAKLVDAADGGFEIPVLQS
jgi:hypothetical protein